MIRKLSAFALLAVLTVGTLGASIRPANKRASVHLIEFRTEKERSVCTATAIAPYVLLTAKHCDLDGGELRLDGSPTPRTVVKKICDGNDGMILMLSRAFPFRTFVSFDPAPYAAPVQGEVVYMWGCPAGLCDLFRTGQVMGATTPDGEKQPVFIAQMPVAPGDSGSSIYAADGRLVGVLTYGVFGGKFAGFYALRFTPEQIAEATR